MKSFLLLSLSILTSAVFAQTINTAAAFNEAGIAYYDQGNYNLAIENYNQAIILDSNFAEAYNNRGNAYGALGNHNNALTDFNQALALPQK